MATLLATGVSLYIAKKMMFTRYVKTDKHIIDLSKNIQTKYTVEFRSKYFDESFMVDNIDGNETHDDIIRLLKILNYKFKWFYRHRLDEYDFKLKSDIISDVDGINTVYYYIPYDFKIKDFKKIVNNRVVIWVDLD